MNQSPAHAELVGTFKRAEAEAAHKFALIKAVANKGPQAIQMAVETAAKAAKRRDAYAKKLAALGINPATETLVIPPENDAVRSSGAAADN